MCAEHLVNCVGFFLTKALLLRQVTSYLMATWVFCPSLNSIGHQQQARPPQRNHQEHLCLWFGFIHNIRALWQFLFSPSPACQAITASHQPQSSLPPLYHSPPGLVQPATLLALPTGPSPACHPFTACHQA